MIRLGLLEKSANSRFTKLTEALRILKDIHGKVHPDIAKVTFEIGKMLQVSNYPSNGKKMMNEALRMLIDNYPDDKFDINVMISDQFSRGFDS